MPCILRARQGNRESRVTKHSDAKMHSLHPTLVALTMLRLSLAVVLFTSVLSAGDPQSAKAEVQAALIGSWTGTLEYRDYSEPPSSSKRTKLPTWLTIEPAGADLRFTFTYDDGPNKLLTEMEMVTVDPAAGTYRVASDGGKQEEVYTAAGFERLKGGLGVLVLTGRGVENNEPVDARTTVRIGRNILEITRETARAGSPFAFRHAYTFVQAKPPAK